MSSKQLVRQQKVENKLNIINFPFLEPQWLQLDCMCYPNIVYSHLVHVLGRGVCKNSSPAVVQHSDLRWPASKLQRKKSISGHRLGWIIWGSRGRTEWSKMEKRQKDRGQKGRDEIVNCSLQTQISIRLLAHFLSVKAFSSFVPHAQSNVSSSWTTWMEPFQCWWLLTDRANLIILRMCSTYRPQNTEFGGKNILEIAEKLNETWGGWTICQEKSQLNVGTSPGILILGFVKALFPAGRNSAPGEDKFCLINLVGDIWGKWMFLLYQ